jgi:hypothetical protein
MVEQKPRGLSTAWRCALVGGLLLVPLSVGISAGSGAGRGLSVVVSLFAGIVAGYLATGNPADVDTDSAGIRAGVVAAVPGLWFVVDAVLFAGPGAGPLWFRVVGGSIVVVLFVTGLFVLASLAGFLGGTVGRRLALKSRRRSGPTIGN